MVDSAQDKARDLGDALETGLDRAQNAIQRAVDDVGSTVIDGQAAIPGSDDDRLYATLAHVSIFVLPIVGPLLVTALKKPETPFVKDQAKEALNYQISAIIATLSFFVFMFVTLGIGGCLMPALFLLYIPPILAAIKVNNNEAYRYPVSLRLIK